jgi:hypothetical protein
MDRRESYARVSRTSNVRKLGDRDQIALSYVSKGYRERVFFRQHTLFRPT